MNTNVAAVVLASVLFCGIMGVTVSPQTTETGVQPPSMDAALGGDISVFMQRSVAAMNGSVDSGMWLAAFESAENQSRKQALVARRAETLGARLNRLEERMNEFTPTKVNRSVVHRARWVRLAADKEALQTAISEAKTAAASAGVNTTSLDRLSRRIANITIAPSTETTARDNSAVNATPSQPQPRAVLVAT